MEKITQVFKYWIPLVMGNKWSFLWIFSHPESEQHQANESHIYSMSNIILNIQSVKQLTNSPRGQWIMNTDCSSSPLSHRFNQCSLVTYINAQITTFMEPTWGPPGSCWPQVGPMLAPWSLISGWLLYMVPTWSLFPGKVITFDHGSLGPGKVLNFSNFFKKVMGKSLFSYQKQVDESVPDIKYFISLASSLYWNLCFANFPPNVN